MRKMRIQVVDVVVRPVKGKAACRHWDSDPVELAGLLYCNDSVFSFPAEVSEALHSDTPECGGSISKLLSYSLLTQRKIELHKHFIYFLLYGVPVEKKSIILGVE
jgi:hypothetical protein